jgi:hypothetical protein
MSQETPTPNADARPAEAASPRSMPPEMDALLAQVRAGLAPGATAATKAQAAATCRVLLVALEATPGQPFAMPSPPMAAPPPPGTPRPASAAPPSATAPAAPPNLLDLITTWAKTHLEAGTPPPHQRVPYIGTAELLQMFGALGTMLGGRTS